jgi:hypothetical protein
MALFRGPRLAAIHSIHAAIMTLWVGMLPAGAADVDISVILDEARLVKLPERVATLVIGNPLIADASLQSGGLMVITGKGYGSTNLIALDRSGAVLLERTVEVKGPRVHTVVVYRGISRETYSCAPDCEPRIVPGDNNVFYENILNQTTTRAILAGGVPQAKSEK